MKKARYVNVDMGYGCHESWQCARVIASQMRSELFGDGQKESLLVQISGGERTWVDFWTEDKPEEAK